MARAYRNCPPITPVQSGFFTAWVNAMRLNNIFSVFWCNNDLYDIPVCTEFPLFIKKFGKHHHIAAMAGGNNRLSCFFYKTGIRFKLLFDIHNINKGYQRADLLVP